MSEAQRAYKTGDLVVLASGGPAMVVDDSLRSEPNLVTCFWFSGEELRNDCFDVLNLRLVAKGEGSDAP